MIRKVALVQALREAFPTTFGGMYSAEETGFVEVEGRENYITTQEGEELIEQQDEMLGMAMYDTQGAEKEPVPQAEPQPENDGKFF